MPCIKRETEDRERVRGGWSGGPRLPATALSPAWSWTKPISGCSLTITSAATLKTIERMEK